jgi:hypothetical protein
MKLIISLAVGLLLTASAFGGTINVLDFGAKVNDNIDDTPAVRAAIAASQRGDTIQFPPGQLDFGGIVTLKGGRTYSGTAGLSVLRMSVSVVGIDSARIFQLDVDDPRDVVLDGLVFDGNGVRLDSTAGWPTNIAIKNCTFRNSTRSANDPNAISWPHGLKNATIDHCNFTDWHGFAGVNGVGFQNVTVSYCTFDSVTAGVNVVNDYEPSTTFTAVRNHFIGVQRKAIFVGGSSACDSILLERNEYLTPDLTGDLTQTAAFVVRADRSLKTVVQRNYVETIVRPDGLGVRRGIDVTGDKDRLGTGPMVQQNWIVGTSQSVFLDTSIGGTVRTNKISSALSLPVASATALNPTISGNGDSTVLDWTRDDLPPAPSKLIQSIHYVITYTDGTTETVDR